MSVTLTEPLDTLAHHVAIARNLSARILGRIPSHRGSIEGSLEADVDGARAEIAFWQFTGRDSRVNAVILMPNLRDIDGDVLWKGYSLEVRSTKHPNGHLIVHPDDPPERLYVLCIATHPTYTFPGYIRGADARRYLIDPDPRGLPNFWVPQDALKKWRHRD